MALLLGSPLLLPLCLVGSSVPSSALLSPPVCPHPCGEHASRLSPCGGVRGSWHHPHMAGQMVERKRILMVFARRILVCRRKGRVASFLTRTGHQLCREMATVYGLVSGLAGSETQREPLEQKTHGPRSSLAQQLERPDLHGCSLPAGPARSDVGRVTHLSAVPPHFLPLPTRHTPSPDSPHGATRAQSRIQLFGARVRTLHRRQVSPRSKSIQLTSAQIHHGHLGEKKKIPRRIGGNSAWFFSPVPGSRPGERSEASPACPCPHKPALAPAPAGEDVAKGIGTAVVLYCHPSRHCWENRAHSQNNGRKMPSGAARLAHPLPARVAIICRGTGGPAGQEPSLSPVRGGLAAHIPAACPEHGVEASRA